MVVNNNYSDIEHVKFISYDGKYPCLCMGTLILEIDGISCKFGYGQFDKKLNAYPENCYPTFWQSGGTCHMNEPCEYDEWRIDIDMLPEKFRKYAFEIDQVFNNNVDYGCCGGCR